MGTAAGALRVWMEAAGGSVPFEEFMQWALYDPEHGYYSRRVRTVGRGGDFSTAATLHTALPDAVAAWAAGRRAEVNSPTSQWHLIELGGGSGDMAARVLRSLGWWGRRGLRYHLVEVSTGLRAAQQERLAKRAGRVSWHETLAGALGAADGRALIFSNEFVDAFPCARWVYRDGWHEVRVRWPDAADAPVEIVGGPVPGAELAVASVAEPKFVRTVAAGQMVEVFASYRAWMRDQLSHWSRGRLLTIDYGNACQGLYHRRPAGTLRAYYRQQRFTGGEVYARVGQQDLTADVNFTDLWLWGKGLGLRPAGLGTQADFLRQWLRPSVLRDTSDARLAALMDPDGAGGAFKVLEQTRGVQIAA